MTTGVAYDGSPEVDYFSLHNRKQKRIDVDMLDYGYVAKCADLDELKGILAMLRSGKEGRYPQLEQATQNRILAVLPAKERKKIESMRSGPSDNELASEKKKLSSWTAQADEIHKALQAHNTSSSGRQLPPVRGQQTPALIVHTPKAKPLITEVTTAPTQKKKAIPAYDFRAWEKYDVDKAMGELDESEQRSKDRVRLQREKHEKRELDRKKELASLPAYIDLEAMSDAERKVLARVEKEKGNDSFRANENDEALLYYTRSIAFYDGDAVLYANRAAAHLRLKNFAQAEGDCARAILLDPLYCKAWRRRGMTRFRRGKYAEAIEDFEHSLRLEPGNVEVEKLLKKTIAKWKEVDGTVTIGSDNQVTHTVASLVKKAPVHQPRTTFETEKPFKRFEIIEEDDEDDDANAPVGIDRTEGNDDEEEEEEKEQKPFQRFEIIEE